MAFSTILLRDAKVGRPGDVSLCRPSCPLLRRGGVLSSATLAKIARNSSCAVGEAQARAWGAPRRTAHPGPMPESQVKTARRVLVAALKSVARAYGVRVDLTNTAPDAAVRAAYRRVFLRAHPDMGGSMDDAQRLSVSRG